MRLTTEAAAEVACEAAAATGLEGKVPLVHLQ